MWIERSNMNLPSRINTFQPAFLTIAILTFIGFSVGQTPNGSGQAEVVLQKAVKNLGGDKYLAVKSQVGRGKFSIFKDNVLMSFQNFVDVIVFPEKERTEFRGGKSRTVQVNVANTGWVYDGEVEKVKEQDEEQ